MIFTTKSGGTHSSDAEQEQAENYHNVDEQVFSYAFLRNSQRLASQT